MLGLYHFGLTIHGAEETYTYLINMALIVHDPGHLIQRIQPLSISGKLKFTFGVNLPGGGNQVKQTHIELNKPIAFTLRTGLEA